MLCVLFFFFKQKTAYEMRISDWSSDVCSSDLAVGFVEDQRLDLRKIDGALANMVKQAARRGDDNLGALRQLLDLRRDADAAKDQDGAHMRQMLAVGAHTFLNLCREFTRRHQHQRTNLLARRLVAAGMQALQKWQS